MKFPDALVALDVDAETLASWRAQPAFTAAHYKACMDHFRHQVDLLQIEEIRKYLANKKNQPETPETNAAVVKPRK